MKESSIQILVREEATKKGCRLWRNNVGACYTDRGDFLRYGLANDSAQLNKLIKSSDLIGIRPVVITHAMVGLTIGQFLSREIKHRDWRWRNTPHDQAQFAWIRLVNLLGGDAAFAQGEGTI